MATVKPFNALRPDPVAAGRICELPYDVVSSEEARKIANGNDLSFFHVSKPEIDLPDGTDPHSQTAYDKARENFDRLVSQAALRRQGRDCFYLYRQIMGSHAQTGLVAVVSCEEYRQGIIKKHELTRPDKEDDRLRHIEILNTQTGPAFLVHRANANLEKIYATVAAKRPDTDFLAPDGIRHSAWTIPDTEDIAREFEKIPALYIADGHHRSAAAARLHQKRGGAGDSAYFLAVIFAHTEVQILPYNRVLKNLNGRGAESLLDELKSVFDIAKVSASRSTEHELGLYLNAQWWRLRFKSQYLAGKNPVERLDAELLQRHVLNPIFGIDDPRTSKLIDFVGGIRGTAELEKMVNSGDYACAFAMFPTSIDEVMAVADAGGIMPPKSTWFEPKLRDGMFCHCL